MIVVVTSGTEVSSVAGIVFGVRWVADDGCVVAAEAGPIQVDAETWADLYRGWMWMVAFDVFDGEPRGVFWLEDSRLVDGVSVPVRVSAVLCRGRVVLHAGSCGGVTDAHIGRDGALVGLVSGLVAELVSR